VRTTQGIYLKGEEVSHRNQSTSLSERKGFKGENAGPPAGLCYRLNIQSGPIEKLAEIRYKKLVKKGWYASAAHKGERDKKLQRVVTYALRIQIQGEIIRQGGTHRLKGTARCKSKQNLKKRRTGTCVGKEKLREDRGTVRKKRSEARKSFLKPWGNRDQ